MKQVVVLAGDGEALNDLVTLGDGLLKRIGVLRVDHNVEEDLHSQADRLRIDQRGISLDGAAALEGLDPAPTR
jgi:hypothetical protein